jgi:D-serine deaminase-like pyridoxal phosphate-dependent protein
MNKLHTEFKDIETPALIIEQSRMMHNLHRMQKICDDAGINLRPHTKTHKTPDLAKIQQEIGAKGIAVAKLGEAEVMADCGFRDIQIANIIVGETKLRRLVELHKRIDRITCTVDSFAAAKGIAEAFNQSGIVMEIFIEINSGLNRSGLSDYGEIADLAEFIKDIDGITLAGILTHAGQAYSAQDIDEVKEIGRHEGEFMVGLASQLRSDGYEINTVSVGSTPTAPYSSQVKGVDELRPGNYIFYDVIQTSLGSCTIDDCALSVLATVIGKPALDRTIIDAGAKALALDKITNPNSQFSGHGYINDKNAVIARVSEEHGVMIHQGEAFRIGEKLRIIPNHACVVMNLFDKVYLVDVDKVIDEYKIKARGKSQ